MKTETKAFVRTTIDLPADLNDKLLKESETAKRSRHAEMIYRLEKSFENGNAKKERANEKQN